MAEEQETPPKAKLITRMEIRLAEKMRQRLEEASEESGLSMAEIVRAALYHYLWAVLPQRTPPPESDVPKPKAPKKQ